MRNLAFIDVGELGWSLYLSAYMRWLKENTDINLIIITLSDRRCLYDGLVEKFIEVPRKFRRRYNLTLQDSYKLRKLSWDELRIFFLPYVPDNYRIAGPRHYSTHIFNGNRKFIPYKYVNPPENGREILVFPRCREGLWARRNLPKDFYSRLINRLCNKFSNMIVRTIGTKAGAYDIEIDHPNYVNWVGKGNDLQDMIDRCQSAVAAVGSQSAPPKISLLQGVPTFIIGHQKERHIKIENWMNTEVYFYEIDRRSYTTFNSRRCIRTAVNFIKRVQ